MGAIVGAISALDEYEYGPDEEALSSIADDIPAGGAGLMLVVEHRWMIPMRDAMRAQGGILIAQDFLNPERLKIASPQHSLGEGNLDVVFVERPLDGQGHIVTRRPRGSDLWIVPEPHLSVDGGVAEMVDERLWRRLALHGGDGTDCVDHDRDGSRQVRVVGQSNVDRAPSLWPAREVDDRRFQHGGIRHVDGGSVHRADDDGAHRKRLDLAFDALHGDLIAHRDGRTGA